MEKPYVLGVIIDRGWTLENEVDGTNYYFSKGDHLLSYTTPHEGNEYSHLIRGEHKDSFERWGNAQVEEYVHDADHLTNSLNTIEKLDRHPDYDDE